MRSTGMIRPHQGTLSLLYRVVDVLIVFSTLYLVAWINDVTWHERYTSLGILSVTLFIIIASHFDIYRSWRVSMLRKEIFQLSSVWMLAAMAALAAAFMFTGLVDYSRFVIGAWIVATAFLLSVWRVVSRNLLYEMRRRGFNSRSVAIVGANALGEKLARELQSATWMGLHFVGFYDDRVTQSGRLPEALRGELKGSVRDLVARAEQNEIDIVYITYPMRAEERTNTLIKMFSNSTVSVYLVPDFNVFDILHGRWSNIGRLPVLSIHENPHSGIDGWLKRGEDIALSLALLAILLVPMLFIAIIIKLTSKGPVIFKQTRYGIDGRSIRVWKFRSMSVMEDGEIVMQAVQDDPRVTPFGRFLRSTSLDELPQFFNVLKGDMSIVGPRPHAIAHNEQYRKLIDGYMLRHKVKPGITGLAQVKGYRGETATVEKMQKRVQYDLEYIRNWSILLDFKLIVLTLLVGFRDKRAY